MLWWGTVTFLHIPGRQSQRTSVPSKCSSGYFLYCARLYFSPGEGQCPRCPAGPRGGSVLLEEPRMAEKGPGPGCELLLGKGRERSHPCRTGINPMQGSYIALYGLLPANSCPKAPTCTTLKGWIKYSTSRGKYPIRCTAAVDSRFQSRLVDLQGKEDEQTITSGKWETPTNICAAFIWLQYW